MPAHSANFSDLPLPAFLIGRIVDHDRVELVAIEAMALAPDMGSALYTRARLAERFHRFEEANALLDQALAAGYPRQEIAAEKAAVLQATGHYREALVLRERLAKDAPGMHTFGALTSLLADMEQWVAADTCGVTGGPCRLAVGWARSSGSAPCRWTCSWAPTTTSCGLTMDRSGSCARKCSSFSRGEHQRGSTRSRNLCHLVFRDRRSPVPPPREPEEARTQTDE